MAEGRDVEDILAELLADDDDDEALVGAANALWIWHMHRRRIMCRGRVCLDVLPVDGTMAFCAPGLKRLWLLAGA